MLGVMLGMLEVSGEGVAVHCSVWDCAVRAVLLCCVFSRMANGQWQTATAWLQPCGWTVSGSWSQFQRATHPQQ